MEMSRAEEWEQPPCTTRILYSKVGAELLANMLCKIRSGYVRLM